MSHIFILSILFENFYFFNKIQNTIAPNVPAVYDVGAGIKGFA
jgi:hypothetical protein